MNLTITPEALGWFKREIDLESDMGIKFFGKVYGSTQVHDGFSIGMSVDRPEHPMIEKEMDGINFFAEEADDWFFKNYDLTVDYDEKLDEPKYIFTEN
ncbi:iron-sulfur cluster biosynthesis protein [Tetragenococcus koreensis]|uniref:Iron-sulfur cluster biosynthesis protein n=1 Tax=Tetragenococcus koreensis TaxID=290335 RepID=A0AAN4RJT8_9ENTE|nr:iron-sulfur cluster biosynthesis protein [Tetragenococcus koreensis]MDN6277999.1 iron-sulfur cluster biosynthesis protein [Lactococcus lactis]AYW45223.1 iron-sulfur cluster biosynthesis protein [Tetragenococcus koreensis]MCF1585876.1 iron-sulfur cluster biosynthesis protein [Tetragenococcus koreensis]MCF1615591.1 iron-sulfur cluster biosynthesis protein [Tetragenococcus koreensis]MCF1620421.1 iron-sulfur cluster biosynthesis protein [Tetragenococcus koreensis]